MPRFTSEVSKRPCSQTSVAASAITSSTASGQRPRGMPRRSATRRLLARSESVSEREPEPGQRALRRDDQIRRRPDDEPVAQLELIAELKGGQDLAAAR